MSNVFPFNPSRDVNVSATMPVDAILRAREAVQHRIHLANQRVIAAINLARQEQDPQLTPLFGSPDALAQLAHFLETSPAGDRLTGLPLFQVRTKALILYQNRPLHYGVMAAMDHAVMLTTTPAGPRIERNSFLCEAIQLANQAVLDAVFMVLDQCDAISATLLALPPEWVRAAKSLPRNSLKSIARIGIPLFQLRDTQDLGMSDTMMTTLSVALAQQNLPTWPALASHGAVTPYSEAKRAKEANEQKRKIAHVLAELGCRAVTMSAMLDLSLGCVSRIYRQVVGHGSPSGQTPEKSGWFLEGALRRRHAALLALLYRHFRQQVGQVESAYGFACALAFDQYRRLLAVDGHGVEVSLERMHLLVGQGYGPLWHAMLHDPSTGFDQVNQVNLRILRCPVCQVPHMTSAVSRTYHCPEHSAVLQVAA